LFTASARRPARTTPFPGKIPFLPAPQLKVILAHTPEAAELNSKKKGLDLKQNQGKLFYHICAQVDVSHSSTWDGATRIGARIAAVIAYRLL
jgi:hypothetical protein